MISGLISISRASPMAGFVAAPKEISESLCEAAQRFGRKSASLTFVESSGSASSRSAGTELNPPTADTPPPSAA